MALTPAEFALKREQLEQIRLMTSDQITQLAGAWVRLWDDLQPEILAALEDLYERAEDGRVTFAAALKHRKLADASRLAKERIDQLSEFMADVVSEDIDQSVKLGAYGSAEIIVQQLPPGYQAAVTTGFARVPTEALDAITLRTTERIHKLSIPLSEDMVAAMKRELIRGVAVGDSPRATARRIMTATEKRFNGGLTRAMTIARTEMMDAHRNGAQAAEKAHEDVLAGWVWIASLQGRTCPACLSKHGSLHDHDEPGPEGHQNCRCTRLPQTKTWAELGFPGVTEPESLIPDAQAWFDNLTEDSQRVILGAGRHDAYLAGNYPMSSWAVKQENPGWRPSWVVSPIPT
jgi:SPP1 gp7 family putative phage head morphogenesis protein